jgi:enoyl-CoA hydratase/carnithine racemase
MARDAGLELPQALGQALVACIGPITAETAREQGLPVHLVAEEYTVDGLVQALARALAANREAGTWDRLREARYQMLHTRHHNRKGSIKA